MGRGQELLDAARKADKSTVEKIIGQITKRSGPFPSIRRGPGVNVRDDTGYTPLHHACLNGHEEIVQLLLLADASPCVTDRVGATPLYLAACRGHSGIVDILLKHNNPALNIDHLTLNRDTALLMAACYGHTEIVSRLVSRGADVTIQNKDNFNALDLAAEFDKIDVVRLLLRMRPQLIDQYRMPVRDGVIFPNTPLHIACKHGRDEVVKELLAAGIDPNLKTEHGTPLHVAACFARDSIVHLLLRRGADLRARDSEGRTVMNRLSQYPESCTRRVRQVIQEFKSQRVSYDSEEDLPPFPVPDSPLAQMSSSPCYKSPSVSLNANTPSPVSNFIEQPVTNANSPSFQTSSPTLSTKHLSPDFFSDTELIIRTDSFLAKEKMFKKMVPYDEVKTGSEVFIKHCEVISEIKSITQALASQTMQSKPLIKNVKLTKSKVYEKVVYNWPDLDSEPHSVRHGKMQNEYYKAEKVNKLSGINNLEKKAKTELHREQNYFHGAKVNQVNTIKNVTCPNDFNGFKPNRSPEVNRLKTRQGAMDYKFYTDEQVNPHFAFDILNSPMKKENSFNDLSEFKTPKYEREISVRRGTVGHEFKKSKSSNKVSFLDNSDFEFGQNEILPKCDTIDGTYRKNYEKKFQASISSSLPKLNWDQCYKSETIGYDFKNPTATRNPQSDSNSLKKKPKTLPKPIITNEISDAIEKLNYGQTDASSPEPLELEQYQDMSQFPKNCHSSELIYENLPLNNMPDDMKAHISSGETTEGIYLTMDLIRRSPRKRFASLSAFNKDIKTERVMTDRLSLSYDYVSFDEVPDLRDKKLTRNLSIPNCFMYGEKANSMHIKGAPGCLHESVDYQYFYVVNPRAERENVHPFIKKREKATPMPCYCQRPDVDKSQVLYYSCETMADEDTNNDDIDDYCSLDEIQLFNKSTSNNSNEPSEQVEGVQMERKLTVIIRKKLNQFKQLATDWTAPETQEIFNKNESFLSPSSSSLTKIHPQSFVKKLASKCLGLKAKFNSAPNISNSTEPEVDVASKRLDHKSNTSNTLLIGNSKFFKILSKKEESGEIVCNDEFDTISLDRGTLNRDSVVNRSNRSCPGFKTSLPNISENNELSDQESVSESLVIIDINCDKKENKADPVNETVNTNLNIFEPRDRFSVISNKSSGSTTLINECYESYEFNDTELRIRNNTIPRPLPRPNAATSVSNDNLIYENVMNIKPKPTPATRTHIPVKLPLDEVEKKVLYENVTLLRDKKPDPPKRTLFPNQIRYETLEKDSSRSASRCSTISSDSMVDESNLEDILLSAKSKSFRHGKVASYYSGSYKSNASRTRSNASNSSDGSDVSALENVDCSEDIDENKAIYLSMTGTLPTKKSDENKKENKKVLFRHKTFTNIEVDRNSVKNKDLPQWNSSFLKETLAHYHIRGTGHCIYKAPTVEEFIYIFNRDSLYKDVPPFTKVPNEKRDSYFETGICFCKPRPPKHHNSAEDLLASGVSQEEEEKVSIDLETLQNRREIFSTSFKCFCASGTCKFHSNRRESINDLVVKFSAIKRSISTPDITLDHSPITTGLKSKLPKNKSVPQNLEVPAYAVVNIEDIVERNKSIELTGYTLMSNSSTMPSHPSTLSSNSSARPYSIKDIAEVISLNRSTSTVSTVSSASDVYLPVRKSSSSEYSGQWSLQSCNSNVTIKSDLSFKSCLEESSDDGSDGTLQSDDDSDAETVKSDISTAKRPWVHSDSFRFGGNSKAEIETIAEETQSSFEDSKFESMSSKFESGISVEGSESSSSGGEDDSGIPRGDTDTSHGASLERGSVTGGVRSGSGRRRWDDLEGTSEGDALSISSAASSCAPLHLMHHYEHSKVSPTPPKKPPRRNLSVSPTHANSPSSGYSYELRIHARSQDDLDEIQGAKHYLKHGRSVDHYESKLSYSEYEENHNSPRVVPIPNPRPSLKQRSQPVAITAMYENVVVKEQNPRRKLRRNIQPGDSYEPRMNDRVRKYSNQERSSLESLLDDQSMNSPSDCERNADGSKVVVPLSPSHYEQPPTPDHPPPSAKQAENSIHERIRPLSQEYKRRSTLRDSYTETEVSLLRAASAASVASGATDRSGNTDNCVEEYVCDVPFAGLFKGSTTTLDGIGLRPMPAERPKTLRKLKSVYDSSPTEPQPNGVERNTNGVEEEVRRRSNTTSSNHSADKSLSILSPFDEQEEWAKISEIMASFGSKLVRESVFVSELEQEFTSRLGLSCSESSLSPSVASNLGLWLAGIGLHDYESLFLEGGYDDIDFVNGVLDENDLREMGIEENDRQKILESSKQLPLKIAEISNNHNNNNISNKNQNESVDEWLRQINLEQYSDTFRKHLYVDMDRVRRIWEVELTAVLEINKAGHRKRILASVSGEQNGPINNHMEDINTDLNTLKNNIQQLKEEIKEKLPVNENLKAVPPPVVPTLVPPSGETLKRSKKNRPAPQPPRPSDLEIRAPSELLVGVPGALKTQWKHQPFVLVTGAVTYVANYLGSTVVKELRGTESTKKSIQKLKKTTKEPRDSPDIILSISYRGVKFLNTITRELVCEHEIRNIHCACQDADDLTHFAYITKDHSTRSHYCHVFRVATMDQATEVILTLGEAFEVAYQMALREQSNRTKVTQSLAKTPTHDLMTTTNREKPIVNHGRSHSITEIKLNGHQLKIAPLPASLSNEDFQAAKGSDGSRSPRTPLLKAPIASTEEL